MLNLKEIGNRIKKYRKQKGFTQAQLAEIIDISTIHMSHLETGSVAMSLECMIKVCNALEVSPDDLLIGEFELNNNATIQQLATTLVGRVLSIFLSICSILIIAVVPGVITSYYVESTKLRADESSAKFLDDLEHLPELSKEELVELSEKVKKFNRKK